MTNPYILEMKNIVKEFPGIKALDGVNFQVEEGEIHALVGENGAGKSTLMKVLSGYYRYGTYQGDIFMKGVVKKFTDPREAEKAGISIIYQELSLAGNLSVAENIYMGNEITRGILLQWDRMYAQADSLLEKVGLKMDSRTKVKDLGIGQQQLVEIAKALRSRSKVLVLDEPTSALTVGEVDNLMALLKKLKKEGVTSIYISHRLEEVFKIADRVTVLRDGCTVGTEACQDLTEAAIIKQMVGRKLDEKFPRKEHRRKKRLLRIKNFTVRSAVDNKPIIRNINLEVYQGEILGIAGLMGAGRTEFVNSIFGAYPGMYQGGIYLENKKLHIRTPRDAIKSGIALITEDRKSYGIIHTANIRENMSIASLDKIPGRVFIQEEDEQLQCNQRVDSLRIKIGSLEDRITSLSGGNQQKVILGRWLMTDPKILILDEPTRGIDVGAKVEIYHIMNQLIDKGVGIVMISSELPEILGMSDRIVVMHCGSISGELLSQDATQEKIMNYAMGGK